MGSQYQDMLPEIANPSAPITETRKPIAAELPMA